MNEFYTPLLDHGALWKLNNGGVICTATPYGGIDSINNTFLKMINKFDHFDSIRLQFLDDRYRFKSTGDYLIVIYYDSSGEIFDPFCSDVELRRKAIQHSHAGLLQSQTVTASFVRDRYISEYAKRRAQGNCQLRGEPAPFTSCDGAPFLEIHHIVWLADGGADSIENMVALCPNCHRKMHILDLAEDVEKLQRIASNTQWP
jgi:predicted restriction endonuclease